jgi:hypothetical protein
MTDDMHKLQAKAVAETIIRSLLVQAQAKTGDLPTDGERLTQCVAWITKPLVSSLTLKASKQQLLAHLEQGLGEVRKSWATVLESFGGKSE